MDLFEIYEAVWQRAREADVVVKYQGLWADHAGFFKSNHDTEFRPTIQIYRKGYKSPSTRASRVFGDDTAVPEEQLRQELLTLSHEYGHFISFDGETPREEWLRYIDLKTRWDEIGARVKLRLGVTDGATFNAALQAEMLDGYTDAERKRILDEEALAWKIGREVLGSLGLEDFTAFDAREQHGLHNYRYRLGVEDLWPCDAVTGYCMVVHSAETTAA